MPPIGGPFLTIHPVILNLAKETLVKVQENLHAAGYVQDALLINEFIQKTDKMLVKGQQGDLHAEDFDLEDHLNEIYDVLEQYKQFIPVDKTYDTYALIVPSTEELERRFLFNFHT